MTTIVVGPPKGITVTAPMGLRGPPGPPGADGEPGKDGTSVSIVGSVPTSASLPTGLGPEDAGDGYIADDTGDLWVWSGTSWSNVRPDPGTSWTSGRPRAAGSARSYG